MAFFRETDINGPFSGCGSNERSERGCCPSNIDQLVSIHVLMLSKVLRNSSSIWYVFRITSLGG